LRSTRSAPQPPAICARVCDARHSSKKWQNSALIPSDSGQETAVKKSGCPFARKRFDDGIAIEGFARRLDAVVEEFANVEADVVVIERSAGKGDDLPAQQVRACLLGSLPS
jgi:hypothetical protein